MCETVSHSEAAFRGRCSDLTGNIATFVPDATGGYTIVDSHGSVLRFAGNASAQSNGASLCLCNRHAYYSTYLESTYLEQCCCASCLERRHEWLEVHLR